MWLKVLETFPGNQAWRGQYPEVKHTEVSTVWHVILSLKNVLLQKQRKEKA